MRTCTRCKRELPLKRFYTMGRSHHSRCMDCIKELRSPSLETARKRAIIVEAEIAAKPLPIRAIEHEMYSPEDIIDDAIMYSIDRRQGYEVSIFEMMEDVQMPLNLIAHRARLLEIKGHIVQGEFNYRSKYNDTLDVVFRQADMGRAARDIFKT